MSIILGTAQFGSKYGISNTQESIPINQLNDILDFAYNHQITMLDTSIDYGNALLKLKQSQLFNKFDLITKLPAIKESKLTKELACFYIENFLADLNQAGICKIHAILTHGPDDLLKPGAAYLIEALEKLKNKGITKRLGASIYTKSQIKAITEQFKLDIIQLPFNLFDQRLLENNYLSQLANKNIEIHARSVFLQGLLLMPPNKRPSYFSKLNEQFKYLEVSARELSLTKLAITLNFVLQTPSISAAVVGVTSKHELQEIYESIIDNFKLEAPKQYQCKDEQMIDPRLWP